MFLEASSSTTLNGTRITSQDGNNLKQLDEAVQIIRKMWTEEATSLEGKYFRMENADCHPKPDPPLHIMIEG